MDQAALVASSTFRPLESGNLYNVPLEFDLRRIALKKEEPLKRELADFQTAVEGGKEPLVTGESALATLRIAECAIESIKTGHKINVS